MKLSVITDIHHPWNSSQLEAAIDESKEADIILIGGDISENPSQYRMTMGKFSRLKGRKLAVLGNHDIYVSEKGDSIRKINHLSKICQSEGVHLLDDSPEVINGVGFVGNIGWYDYSFAETNYGAEITCGFKGDNKSVRDLSNQDFQRGVFGIRDGNETRYHRWADKQNIKFEFTDQEFLKLQLEKLERDLDVVDPRSDQIVYLTHHVPIKEFVYPKPASVIWGVFNGYQGSPKLGELAMSNPKIKTVICGHTHIPNRVEIGNVRCYDPSREFGQLKALHIEI